MGFHIAADMFTWNATAGNIMLGNGSGSRGRRSPTVDAVRNPADILDAFNSTYASWLLALNISSAVSDPEN